MHEDYCIGINYAHMFPKCLKSLEIVGFRIVLRVDLVLRDVNGVPRRCDRRLNQYPKILHISHRANGSFEVLSLHTPSVAADRRQL